MSNSVHLPSLVFLGAGILKSECPKAFLARKYVPVTFKIGQGQPYEIGFESLSRNVHSPS